MIEVVQLVRGVLTVKITGRLTAADIGQLRATTRRSVEQWIKIRVLIILQDFDGYARNDSTGAAVMEADGQAIEKMAIVGDERRRDLGELLCPTHPKAPIEFFPASKRDEAVIWILDGL